MKVKQLIGALKKCNPELDVRLFAHDHDREDPEQGDGEACDCEETVNRAGEAFVSIHA